jgi:cytochrome c
VVAKRETTAQRHIQPRATALHTYALRTSADGLPPDRCDQTASGRLTKLMKGMSVMIGRIVLFTALMTSSGAAFAADSGGDPISGRAIFQHICQNCHSAEIGVNKVGPSLWNVVGRSPASVPDYAYSEAMKVNKTAWSVSALDAYLADPRGDVHGAKMFFKGLPEPKDRADVIAYLASLK